MSTTRGVEARERRRRKKNKKKTRDDTTFRTRVSIWRMKTRWKRKGGGFPLSSPSLSATLNRMNFSAPFQLFTRLFPCRFSNPLRFRTHQTLARRLSTRTHAANALFLYPAFCFLIPRTGMSGGCEETRTEIRFFPARFFCSFSLSLFSFSLFLFLRSVKINVSKKSLVLRFRYRRKFFNSTCESW